MPVDLALPRSLASALHAEGVQDVRADATTRAAYSSDASLYRVVPSVLVFPHDPDEVLATLAVCRRVRITATVHDALVSTAFGRTVRLVGRGNQRLNLDAFMPCQLRGTHFSREFLILRIGIP